MKMCAALQEDAVLQAIHGRASVSADGEGKVIAADIKNLEQNEAAEIPSSVWLEDCGRAERSLRTQIW